jgi:PTH1 family peptidyl-tRNA hydrolase
VTRLFGIGLGSAGSSDAGRGGAGRGGAGSSGIGRGGGALGGAGSSGAEGSKADLRLVIGLGNPGAEYAATRHNAGFIAIGFMTAEIAGQREPYARMRCDAMVSELPYAGKSVVLAMPQTYMNLSGQSVKGLLKHYGILDPEDRLIVVHDDLDLPVGALRIRVGGSAGGHRGIASIINAAGTGFIRVKIGVGRPPGQMPSERYVLQTLRGEDLEGLKADAARAAAATMAILRDGVTMAQNSFNAS